MTPARSMLARLATLAAMAIAAVGLVRLFDTSAAPRLAAHDAHASSDAAAMDPIAAMADAWCREINFTPAYAALNPYADASAQLAAAAFNPQDDYWGLPRSEGVETVAAYCSACHSLQIVMAQHQSREGWDYLLHWMVEKQGMAPPAPEMRQEILAYLTREFGAGEP